MTIVVWDGETLAADKYTTLMHYSRDDAFRHVITRKLYFEKAGLSWNTNERLLVAGAAGTVKHIAKVINFIRDVDANTSVEKLLNKYLSAQITLPDVELLFVTDSRAIKYARSESSSGVVTYRAAETCHEPKVKTSDQPDLLAIGGLSKFVVAMKKIIPAATAVDLIALTTSLNSDYGGGIDYWSLDNPVIRTRQVYSAKEKQRLKTCFSKMIDQIDIRG